ncbi:hypothetical protein [Luteolibacter sp. Populi]|uniref:InlB B-repeat-containing protein n=1 Tax=Luteolibacter sp. Populi TaxID=3230487 RepID=UPI0034676D59
MISEGTEPVSNKLGPNPSTAVLAASTPVPVIDLGVLSTTPTDTPFNLAAGELAIYRVTVPAGSRLLEAYITGRTGNPGISLLKGTAVPKPFPATTSGANGYGWTGGQNSSNHPVLMTVHEPEAGVYTLVVRANPTANNTYLNGAGTLHVRGIQELPEITALGVKRSHAIVGQFAEAWQYFTLVVPENPSIAGIHLALRNVSSGQPRMVVRKGGTLPRDFSSTNFFGAGSATWPDDAQWYQDLDFTGIIQDSAGGNTGGRGFLAPYNAPMGPGTYTIGVTKGENVNTVNNPDAPPMSYTIDVDCIGTGPEMDNPLGTVTADNTGAPQLIPALGERDIRFFKVAIPAGSPSWRMMLAAGYPAPAGPSPHDGILAIHKDRIPTFDINRTPGDQNGAIAGVLNRADYFTLLPETEDEGLEGGDYYIAVTSLGLNPGSKTGSEPCDLTLVTRGELPVEAIEPLAVGGETSLPFSLAPTELAAYRFVVPESAGQIGYYVSIDRNIGKSNFSLRRGDGLPEPPGAVGTGSGFQGGIDHDYETTDVVGGQIVYNAEPGTYEVIVRSTGNTPSTGSIAVGLFDPGTGVPTVECDGGTLTVNNAGATTDILPFRVVIPNDPNLKGWGVTLTGYHSGKPCIIMRRGEPVTAVPGPAVGSDDPAWPNLAQWKQTEDYTKLELDTAFTGTDRDRSQQFFVAARGRPLEPGVYYIGIDNRGTTLVSPRSFTIRTFTFGEGYSVPITDLAVAGSSAPISVAEPRMPAAFKITIPPLTKAWSVQLANTLGDFTLRVRKDFIPDTVNSTYPDLKGGVHVQKAGDERFTLLPKAGDEYITPGDYYLVAASEGKNSSFTNQTIGTGIATGTITNLGPIPVLPLGTVSEAGISQAVSLAPAEVKFYTVEVPAGVNNLQFRLNDRSGEASIVVLPGTRVPVPGLAESYGVFGGQTDAIALKKDKAIVNLGNPAAGIYTVAVRAGGTLPSAYAPASATLAIDILKPAPLNFSQEFNEANGFSHTDARSLADKEKYFYRVAMPPQGTGADEILGWMVTLDQGSPIVRIYRSETEFGKTPPVTMVGRTALIVPPLLTFGANWFIEVEGVGTTDYVIRSEPVTLTAPAWELPAAFNAHAGDSNPGEPDGIGAGRQLPQDHWEFYALDVPEENLGLMRVVMEASNGNPNVYIRQDGIPTTDHKNAGTSGNPLYQFKMVSQDSEAGNFSEPSDTLLQPDRLKPGRYYIGVKSDPVGTTRTSSRYRLKAHSGVVTNLDINSPVPLSGQNLAEKDWRYYRVTIPRTGIPENWYPAFTRLNGTAQLYIRDDLPPFFNTTTQTFVDWGSDLKNKVPASAYVKTPPPGTATLAVPPLRPGETYYLGFYGATGGAFEVSSTASAAQVPVDAEMTYDTGSTTFTIPAGQKRLVRFHVPAEATRVKFDCSQTAPGVFVKLEQGAPPGTVPNIAAHLQSGVDYPAFFPVNRALGTAWPFVAKQDYYLLLTNTTTASIDSTVTMKGVTAATEDEDIDGLPDAWERLYFNNSLTAQTGAGDPDADGSKNLLEYQNGTIPTDVTSALYGVVVAAPGGTFNVSPQQALYSRNATVTLTATPSPGTTFRRWSCPGTPIDGNTNPNLTFQIQNEINAKAIFELPLGKALDTPDTQAWTTSGNGAWFGQFEYSQDGQDAASSPPIALNNSATLATTLTGPGTLTFRWRVSSRINAHYLTLLLDNIVTPQVAAISGTTMTDWALVTLAIPTGNHTVAWRYSKNNTSVAGEDRGWVDRVTYTGWPSDTPTLDSWRLASFTTAELGISAISGPEADPDRDGIENLLEAALGLGPKSADRADEALKLVSAVSAGANLTITLESKVAAQPPSDIVLRLQAGNGLGSWTTLSTKAADGNWSSQAGTNASETNSGASRDPVVFAETIPLSGSGRRFYRLAAELAP